MLPNPDNLIPQGAKLSCDLPRPIAVEPDLGRPVGPIRLRKGPPAFRAAVPEAAVNKNCQLPLGEDKIGTTRKIGGVHPPALEPSADQGKTKLDLCRAVASGADPPHPLAPLLLAHDVHCRPAPQNAPRKEMK